MFDPGSINDWLVPVDNLDLAPYNFNEVINLDRMDQKSLEYLCKCLNLPEALNLPPNYKDYCKEGWNYSKKKEWRFLVATFLFRQIDQQVFRQIIATIPHWGGSGGLRMVQYTAMKDNNITHVRKALFNNSTTYMSMLVKMKHVLGPKINMETHNLYINGQKVFNIEEPASLHTPDSLNEELEIGEYMMEHNIDVLEVIVKPFVDSKIKNYLVMFASVPKL
jgi:hypothetical protein